MRERIRKWLRGSKGEVNPVTVILTIMAVLVVVPIMYVMLFTLSDSSAINRLESQGYTVLAAGEYDSLTLKMNTLQVDMDTLILEGEHDSDLFPAASNETITLTAGAVANVFSAWVEIEVDVSGETFSSRFAALSGHISGALVEDLSVKDKRYVLETAYGDSKIGITKHRFVAGDVKNLIAIQYITVRAAGMPIGETIYYRMMCETADATCEISFRYHYHE